MKADAILSPCRTYRYSLSRIWDETLPLAAFIGLNPSTADESNDDRTILRCIGFGRRENCGGIIMLNLFSFRATKPKDMLVVADPIGPHNNLVEMLKLCKGPHIACWGKHGKHLGRQDFIKRSIGGLVCFGLNSDGSPRHPLYLKADSVLVGYTGM